MDDQLRRGIEVIHSPTIDIEDFMRGNPILIRDSQQEGPARGCAVALMTLPAAVIQSVLRGFGV